MTLSQPDWLEDPKTWQPSCERVSLDLVWWLPSVFRYDQVNCGANGWFRAQFRGLWSFQVDGSGDGKAGMAVKVFSSKGLFLSSSSSCPGLTDQIGLLSGHSYRAFMGELDPSHKLKD